MNIWRAEYESRSFSFYAYGMSKKEALDSLYMGLAAHQELYELASDWYHKDDIYVKEYKLGSAYRDTTEIYTRGE